MKNRGRLIEVLYKAETGPIIDEKEFEAKLITSTVKNLIKKYNVKFDRETIVPSDDDLADRIFQAGLEFTQIDSITNDQEKIYGFLAHQ